MSDVLPGSVRKELLPIPVPECSYLKHELNLEPIDFAIDLHTDGVGRWRNGVK